jgi:predicted RNA-binding protein with RPS1 domain
MGSSLPQHKVHKVFSLEGRSFVVCMLMVKVLSIDETLGSSIKQTARQRGMEERRERTQVRATRAKPKVGHKGANEQIMFQRPHQLQEAYKKRKGRET